MSNWSWNNTALAVLLGFADAVAPAAPRADEPVLLEWREEFADPALPGWRPFGQPEPRWLARVAGRVGVFDNHGDPSFWSGATSEALVSAPHGFEFAAEVLLDVTAAEGCWLAASIGLTRDANRRPRRAVDDPGECDHGAGLTVQLYFAGDRCWADAPERRRHSWLQCSFATEGGPTATAEFPADDLLHRWVELRVEVDDARAVRLLVDGRPRWLPSARLHRDVLTLQRLVLGSRSAGSAGRAYHDRLEFRSRAAPSEAR